MYKKIGTFVFSLMVSALSLSPQEAGSYELKKEYPSEDQEQKKAPVAVSEQYKKALEELKALLPPLSDQDLAEIMRLSKKGRMLLLFGGENFDKFIGCLNCRNDVSISVWNSKGKYGSPYSTESIWNSLSEAGSPVSRISPWSPYASKPPLILDNTGKDYGLLTVNLRHKFRAVGGLASTLCKYSGRISENPERWYRAIFKDNLNEVFTVPETAAADDADAAKAAKAAKAEEKPADKTESKEKTVSAADNGTQSISSDSKDSVKEDKTKAVNTTDVTANTAAADKAQNAAEADPGSEDRADIKLSENKSDHTDTKDQSADAKAFVKEKEEIKSASPAVNIKKASSSEGGVFKDGSSDKAGIIIRPAEEKEAQSSKQHIIEESEGEILIISG